MRGKWDQPAEKDGQNDANEHPDEEECSPPVAARKYHKSGKEKHCQRRNDKEVHIHKAQDFHVHS